MLDLLGIPGDGHNDFHTLNAAKADRFQGLASWGAVVCELKDKRGIKGGVGFFIPIIRLSSSRPATEAIDDKLRLEIRDYFYRDIEKLGCLAGRDLRRWK